MAKKKAKKKGKKKSKHLTRRWWNRFLPGERESGRHAAVPLQNSRDALNPSQSPACFTRGREAERPAKCFDRIL